MTVLEFSAVFTLGLVSGLHCLQMCGPIVLSYSLSMPKGQATMLAHLSYNAGRILTYTFLGALAGVAGKEIGLLGKMAGLATGARILAGAAMVVAGLLMFNFFPASGLIRIQKTGVTARFSRLVGKLLQAPGAGGKLRLGLLLGFLPCGLIYAALLKSVETAAAPAGALTMLAFGLGTAMALLGMGMASSLAGLGLRRWSNRLAPAGVMLFGAMLLWRGLVAPGAPLCHAHF